MKKRMKKRKQRNYNIVVVAILLVSLFVVTFITQQRQNTAIKAAPSADLQTDRTNLSFKGSQYTSEYHLYAAGLDWTKSVGMLLYTDGSGEYGLKNPSGSYLMGGSTGLIAVAKKHNMVLVTPLSPNKSCSDGDGSCWYLGDSEGYVKWAEELVTQIQSQYPIDKRRVAVGGYSSGAQFSTEFWVPSGAAQRTMTDGVIVAISYGGAPQMSEVSYSSEFKANVHMGWNTGDQDSAYTGGGNYGVKGGYDHYTSAGFQTTLEVLPGVSHDRSGDFGPVMDLFITKHVPPATAAAPSSGVVNPSTPPVEGGISPTTVVPTYYCGGSASCAPTPSPSVYQPQITTAPPINSNPDGNTQPDTNPEVTETPQEPETQITQAPDNQNNQGRNDRGNRGNNRGNGGIWAMFMEFIARLFELLLSLFR